MKIRYHKLYLNLLMIWSVAMSAIYIIWKLNEKEKKYIVLDWSFFKKT
jgi:hypothetical protein